MVDLDTKNIVDVLLYRAINQAEKRIFTFLQDGEAEAGWLTYQELDRWARAIASALQSHHRQGERALLLYPSGLDFIAAFFGCEGNRLGFFDDLVDAHGQVVDLLIIRAHADKHQLFGDRDHMPVTKLDSLFNHLLGDIDAEH